MNKTAKEISLREHLRISKYGDHAYVEQYMDAVLELHEKELIKASEIWKTIPQYPNYMASTLGRIK